MCGTRFARGWFVWATLALVGSVACSSSEGQDETGTDGDTGQYDTDTHGTFSIELGAADASVFYGTERITVSTSYGADCLGVFYDSDANWLYDGVDGALVFEDWASRLCDKDEFDNLIDCEVISIEQMEFVNGLKLRIHYRVLNGDLHNKEVRVGPVPKEELAGCYPIMRIDSGTIGGFDNADPLMGGQVWHVESYDTDQVGIDEGAPAVVTAAN
jgi:hypothetical protein